MATPSALRALLPCDDAGRLTRESPSTARGFNPIVDCAGSRVGRVYASRFTSTGVPLRALAAIASSVAAISMLAVAARAIAA